MNSPSAKFTIPVMPKVSVTPSAMIPYSVPTMTPLSVWPTSSWSIARVSACVPRSPALLNVDVGHADLAAPLQAHHVEVYDLLALLVVADLPETLIGHGQQLLADPGYVIDAARLLYRLDQHEQVIVAGGRAERRLIVREVALVECLVIGDEPGDLGIGLLGLLEIFRHIDEIVVDLILVLEAGAKGAANKEELSEII